MMMMEDAHELSVGEVKREREKEREGKKIDGIDDGRSKKKAHSFSPSHPALLPAQGLSSPSAFPFVLRNNARRPPDA